MMKFCSSRCFSGKLMKRNMLFRRAKGKPKPKSNLHLPHHLLQVPIRSGTISTINRLLYLMARAARIVPCSPQLCLPLYHLLRPPTMASAAPMTMDDLMAQARKRKQEGATKSTPPPSKAKASGPPPKGGDPAKAGSVGPGSQQDKSSTAASQPTANGGGAKGKKQPPKNKQPEDKDSQGVPQADPDRQRHS